MLDSEKIERIAESSAAAREILREVEAKLSRLVAAAANGKPVDELSHETALEVVQAVLERRHTGGSPPWSPPRYQLDTERSGATKRMLLTDYVSGKDVKLYVTLNFYPDGGPAELFVTKQSDSSTIGALLDAVAIVVSIALQYGVPWEKLCSKMVRHRFPPYGRTSEESEELRFVQSILDYVFKWADKKVTESLAAGKSRERTSCTSSASSDDETTSPSS